MLIVAKGSKVLLHRLDMQLGWTVCLWEESSREAVIDTVVEANSGPKLSAKHFATIGGDIVQSTSIGGHMFEEHLC
jgi:hypothetical protein